MAFTFVIPILFFFLWRVEVTNVLTAHEIFNEYFFFRYRRILLRFFFQHRTLSHFNAIHIAYLVCSERPRDSRQLQSLDESNLLILLMEDLFFFSLLWCWCGTYKKLDFYFVEITLFLPTIFHIVHSTEHSKRNHTWNIDTEEAKKKNMNWKWSTYTMILNRSQEWKYANGIHSIDGIANEMDWYFYGQNIHDQHRMKKKTLRKWKLLLFETFFFDFWKTYSHKISWHSIFWIDERLFRYRIDKQMKRNA